MRLDLALSSPMDWLLFIVLLLVAGFFWAVGAWLAQKILR